MTPEELEELRALVGRLNCTAYDENLAAILGAVLEHIDQQAASLDEAEALIKKNAALMNDYLARIAELENIICGPLVSITEILEKTNADLIASNVVQMWKDENQTLKTQIAALQEIAVEQKAMRICTIPANWWNEGEQVKEYFRASARDQLRREHPEAFG